MKTSKNLIYAVVLWTLVECQHAGRIGRSLDVAGRGGNLTQKQQQEVIHADVLQHFTSTPAPPSPEKERDTVQEATSSFIKDVPFIPEEINVQSLKNDDHLHVTYDRKITIDKENPTEDSADVKNKTVKSQTNDVISYTYNQTGPSSSVTSEVELSHSSYEHSSTSVVYDEEDEENEETHSGFRPAASSDIQKPESERKTYEVKKKGGKKEIPDSATVPTDYSGAGRIEKPYKDNTISVKLKDKKESISEALDDRRSTTIRISNSSSVSLSEQEGKPLGSLDILKVGLSDTNNEESVNQSVNSVINANGVNSDTKKPRVKYSVKRPQDVMNNTENESPSAGAGGNQLSEATKNNVPVLSLEPLSTPPTVSSSFPAKTLNSKPYPQLQRRHPTESSPTKLDILGKFATPSTTTIVKPSIAFKQQLANKLKGFEPAPTIPMNVSEDTTDENSEKTVKSSTKSNLRKKPKLDHSEMYIPPTATAWTLVSMRQPGEGLSTSRKPTVMLAINSSTPTSRPTVSTLRPTTITPVTRVKSFVPWSTRLQKTTRPPSTLSVDDLISPDNTAAISDSSMSSSSSNNQVQKKSESLKRGEFLSSASTTEDQSVIRTTLELDRNLTETSSNLIQPSLNDVMVKDQSSTVSHESAKGIRGASTERLPITSSTVMEEQMTENSTRSEGEGRVAEKENIIETKQSSEESEPKNKIEGKSQEKEEEKEIPTSANNTANEVTITDGSDSLNKIKPSDLNQNFSQTVSSGIPISEVQDAMKIKNISEISDLDPGTGDILVDGVEEGKSGEESEEDLKPKQTTTLPPMFEPFETTMMPDLDEDVDGESEREDEELSVIVDKLANNQTAIDNGTKISEMDIEVKLPTTTSLPVANNVNTTGTYVTSFDIVSKENTTQVVTKTPSEGDINWYNIDTKPLNASEVETTKRPPLADATTTAAVESTLEPETTTEMSIQETTVLPETTQTVTLATSTASAPTSDPSVGFEDGTNFESVEDPTSCVRIVVHVSPLKLCHGQQQLRESIASQLATDNVSSDQILIMSKRLQDCGGNPSTQDQHLEVDVCFVDKFQEPSPILRDEFLKLYTKRANDPSFPIVEVQMIVQPPTMSSGFDNVLAAIILSVIAAVCLVLLGILLVIIRKRQGKFNYGQRCTPVSLDDYSLDNISVYNSVRRKGALRASKRSYGNPAFDDPGGPTHTINFAGLANFSSDREALDEEFNQIPMITVKPDELPPGAESKNRYANVIPLPETRVPLAAKEGSEPLDEYINANYIKGPKGQEKLYIACQAPLQSTVEDFWRMVWQQQTKVILMLTALNENGVEKCADYLPQLEITDCHRLFGDFQVTLKKHEVREKYIISSLQLKNLETNLWREVTHLWYSSWPPQGVPEDGSAMIAFLIEARSYMRGAQGPTVVHCSPGTGRTGTVIAIDLCIRDFETIRSVDIPKTVYALRRDRAGAVQTKDQYAFIYQVLNLYATKLTGGALDSI